MLRAVFGCEYPEAARATGKSEANCRQIFARARKRIAAGGRTADAAPPPARRAEGEELARTFFEAAAGGEVGALLDVLAPDVVYHGDGGGKARAVARAVTDPHRVGRLLIGGLRRLRSLGASWRPAVISGRPGALIVDAEGRVASVVELGIVDGVVLAVRT
ncbi:sigma factor-like helix-turn-helix DNA-binding protein, partial [Streptomyces sp. NPDC059956]|uniref:sigma factor-like helix-turn-helix DNA-binding protein n=1 Tax=Streptomyces sp. NPDC059956 TaxID=3347015 RepID=UPI00364CE569